MITVNTYASCPNGKYLTTSSINRTDFASMKNCIRSNRNRKKACKCAQNQKEKFNIKADNSYIQGVILDKAVDEIEEGIISLGLDIAALSVQGLDTNIASACSIDKLKKLPKTCQEKNKKHLKRLKKSMIGAYTKLLDDPKKINSCPLSQYDIINIRNQYNKVTQEKLIIQAAREYKSSHPTLSHSLAALTEGVPPTDLFLDILNNPISRRIFSSKEIATKLEGMTKKEIKIYLTSEELTKKILDKDLKNKCNDFYKNIETVLCDGKTTAPSEFFDLRKLANKKEKQKKSENLFKAETIFNANQGLLVYCSQDNSKSNFFERMESLQVVTPAHRKNRANVEETQAVFYEYSIQPTKTLLCPNITPPKNPVAEHKKLCLTEKIIELESKKTFTDEEKKKLEECALLDTYITLKGLRKQTDKELALEYPNITLKKAKKIQKVKEELQELASEGDKQMLVTFLTETEAKKVPKLKAFMERKKKLEENLAKLEEEVPEAFEKAGPGKEQKDAGTIIAAASIPKQFKTKNTKPIIPMPKKLSSDVAKNMDNFYRTISDRLTSQQEGYNNSLREDITRLTDQVDSETTQSSTPRNYSEHELDTIAAFSPNGKKFADNYREDKFISENMLPSEFLDPNNKTTNQVTNPTTTKKEEWNNALASANRAKKAAANPAPEKLKATISFGGFGGGPGSIASGGRSPANSTGSQSRRLLTSDSIPIMKLEYGSTLDEAIEQMADGSGVQLDMLKTVLQKGKKFKIKRKSPSSDEIFEVLVQKTRNGYKLTPYGNEADAEYRAFLEDIRKSSSIKNNFKSILIDT